MARKTTKSTPKKKTAAKSSSKKTAASPPKAPVKTYAGRNPAYVLIIMILIATIAVMVNKFNSRQEPRKQLPDDVAQPKEVPDHKSATAGEKAIKNGKTETAVPRQKQRTDEAKKEPVKKENEEVKIFFVKLNEQSEKMYLVQASRRVPGEPILENTLKELIKGPTPPEKKKGLLTAVPTGLKLNSVKIRNKVAEIDFNAAIEQGAGGSVLLNRIDQIVYTATQFPNVKSVIIKINGKTRQTLGTDGLSIGGPLHRRQ